MNNLLLFSKKVFVEAEQHTIASGKFTASALLRMAGARVAEFVAEVCAEKKYKRLLIVCGPGNNGGDGMVAAICLMALSQIRVTVWFCGEREQLSVEAKEAYDELNCRAFIIKYSEELLDSASGYDVIIDALFGTGLNRCLDDFFCKIIDGINRAKKNAFIISVDIPSGFDCSAMIGCGSVVFADATITFTVPKIFHVLMPGLQYTGKLIVRHIPIDISSCKKEAILNHPSIWLDIIPELCLSKHKYSRGYAVIYGGKVQSAGAAILAASAAQRSLVGVIKVLLPDEADLLVYRLALPCALLGTYADNLDDRVGAILVGPGNGVNSVTKENVVNAIKFGRCILDADALSVFKDEPGHLFSLIKQHQALVIMTPHEGEFASIFPECNLGDKLQRVRDAAQSSGAIVLLKGPDTVIADPIGRVFVNCSCLPHLATAGSGDVLSGIITALMAATYNDKEVPPILLAAAGAYIHSQCAIGHSASMTAEDLISSLRNFAWNAL